MIYTNLIATAICTLLATSAAAEMPPLEIKGLAPGQSVSSIASRPGWTCEVASQRKSTLCSSRTETIAGRKTKAIFTTIWRGQAIDVNAIFSATDFLQVRDALIGKYGQPKTDPRDPTALEWTNGDRLLRLQLHSPVGNLTSSLALSDKQTAHKLEQAQKARVQADSADL